MPGILRVGHIAFISGQTKASRLNRFMFISQKARQQAQQQTGLHQHRKALLCNNNSKNTGKCFEEIDAND